MSGFKTPKKLDWNVVTWRMHIHLSTDDTCPAERLNASIGDAVVDRGGGGGVTEV